MIKFLTNFGIVDKGMLEQISNRFTLLCPGVSLGYSDLRNLDKKRVKLVLESQCMAPTVSIITVLYGGISYTEKFLKSLAKIKERVEYELIILDNNSPDETRSKIFDILKEFKLELKTTLLFAYENTNFSGGNNFAASFAKGKFLLFLNNDTEVSDYFISYMLDNFSDQNVGIVGAKLLYPQTHRIQHAGVMFLNFGAFHPFKYYPFDHKLVNRKLFVNAVTGACLMIRKDTFFKVGGFNISLVNELEDLDLCLKVRNLGLKIVYDPRAVVYHFESQSPGRKNALRYLRNYEIFRVLWPDLSCDYKLFLSLKF